MRGSDFAELRAFATVAHQRSFARAARQLGLSPSALSLTIRKLEERLGVRLLNRTTRSVAPSAAGERLLARLGPALAEIAEAVADAAGEAGEVTGRLRINAPRLAATHHLGPLAGPFLLAHPRVALEIVVEDRFVDIVAGGFDAGVRLGESVQRDMVAVRLGGPLEMMAVASPAYLVAMGAPATPRDLRRHRCINQPWPSDGAPYRWEFERGAERLDVAVEGPLQVNDAEVALHAARAGLGIAYLFEHVARDPLARGEVVRVLAEWSPPFAGFHLYYPGRRGVAPPLRAFLDFLAARERHAA